MGPRAGTEEYMQEQINRLAEKVQSLTTLQATNHEQNRKSIHDIREGQQKYTDALYLGFEKMAAALEKSLLPIKQDVAKSADDIFNLQMWRSKTTGYVLGISAMSAFISAVIFKVVEVGLSKAGMH